MTVAAISNQAAMNHFLVIIAAIVIVMLIVVILGSKNSRLHKIINLIIQEETDAPVHHGYSNGMPKHRTQPRTERVMLVQKIDERKRVTDARGHFRLFHEYYELVFRTSDGKAINIVTNKDIYKKVQFNQQGRLTYLRDKFIKFKTNDGEIIADDVNKK